VRKARNRRVNEMRAVLKLALTVPWVHRGVHKVLFTNAVRDPRTNYILTAPIATQCLCRQCVIEMAYMKFGISI